MAKSKSKPQRMLPQYIEWRDGRPRWNGSPKLKALGWRGADLKDEHGEFLGFEATHVFGAELNAAVTAFLGGAPVPLRFAAWAPEKALVGAGKASLPTPPNERSIGFLHDAYFETLQKADKTVRDYKSKVGITLQTIADLSGVTLETIRARDIATLKQPKEGSGLPFLLLDAYEEMRDKRGLHMGRACITATSAWLRWVKKKRNLLAGENPCRAIDTTLPEGRRVVYTDAELDALVEAADYVGLPSLGDAIVLAVDATWSQQDLLALRWDKVDGFSMTGKRQKTNIDMAATLQPKGRKRLLEIRSRQAAWPIQPTHVITSELDFQPWKEDYLRHWFSMLRDIASAAPPYGLGNNGIREKQFRDLRDTAITRLKAMGMDPEMIATRSGHTFGSVRATLDKHYIERETVGRAADAFLQEYHRKAEK